VQEKLDHHIKIILLSLSFNNLIYLYLLYLLVSFFW